MTRINVGINPSELTVRHLIAEHREIKRIPNAIKRGRFNLSGIPPKFTLGKGHVKFFYNKLLYLRNRYIQLHDECIKRGYNVSNFIDSFNDLPIELMNDYVPTQEDIDLIKSRINDKLKQSKMR